MIRSLVRTGVLLTLLATPAMAEKQTYTLTLGSRAIGTLVFDVSNGRTWLMARMDNTPLGVANGTFEAITRRQDDARSYESASRGSKSRDIAVTWNGSKVTDVTVTPATEATVMTDAASVPVGVMSPSEGYAALATATTCPPPFAMYDGRRVVQVRTTASTTDADTVTCEMSYRVVQGPGHLSPFRFRSIGMQAVYASGALRQIRLSAGGFSVYLRR